jgi:hypothetical protein
VLSWLRRKQRTDCACEACRSSCENRPGWFAPGEATRAAQHLGLTLEQLFAEKLVIDWYEDLDGEEVEVLAPATERQTPGTRATEEDPRHPSRCRLLGAHGCLLPFELRPIECRSYYGCDPSTWTDGRSRALAEAWSEQREELVLLRNARDGVS